jgi:NAD(P)-dependent dehydrogenase (short-subunit alcohol dehydrogenase family)
VRKAEVRFARALKKGPRVRVEKRSEEKKMSQAEWVVGSGGGKRLQGRTVLVIGAGSIAPGWGNGKASAVAYAREGAAVVCVDRRLDAAAETASIIESEGNTSIAFAADATTESDVQAAVDATVSAFGRVDVLHNNVGVGGTGGLPDRIAPPDWEREIRQNLTSAYLGIRCAVPIMRQQGGGVITNTSSTLAVRFLRHQTTAYTVAKAGVEALTRSCAAGYGGDNIRVNCLRIGFSETPLVLAWSHRLGDV